MHNRNMNLNVKGNLESWILRARDIIYVGACKEIGVSERTSCLAWSAT